MRRESPGGPEGKSVLTPVDPGSLLSEVGDLPLACQGNQDNVACSSWKAVPGKS